MSLRETLRAFLFLAILQYPVIHLIAGCSSPEKHEQEYWEKYNCPIVVWKYLSTADKKNQDDWFAEQGARRGCIRYYGEGACLVSMTKTGKDSYYAICRRK